MPSFTAANVSIPRADVVSLVDSPAHSSPESEKNSSAPSDVKAYGDPSTVTENVGSKRTLKAAAGATEMSGLSVADFRGSTSSATRSDVAAEERKFKVSFKLPDNKRIPQEFRHDSTVYDIFAHVVNEKLPNEAEGNVDLIVGFPPKSVLSTINKDELSDSGDMTRALLQSIPAEILMAGQLVTVKWTE